MKAVGIVFGMAVLLALPTLELGQPSVHTERVAADSTQSNQTEMRAERGKGKGVQVPKLTKKAIRIFLDKIEVAGQVERPQAIFIIPGKSPEVQDVRIDRSFFKEIFRDVEMPSGARKKVRQAVRPELILW